MVITLIGYRGTGKSTVAAPLAERLGWDWVDADVAIEARAGKSIQCIFAEDGEPAFRQLERDVLHCLLAGDSHLVIAAGGGAILDEQTRRDMRNAGKVIWLKASPETIVARMEADTTTADRRPNLTRFGGRREVDELLAIRNPLYNEAAHLAIETEGRTVEEIVEQISRLVSPPRQEGATG